MQARLTFLAAQGFVACAHLLAFQSNPRYGLWSAGCHMYGAMTLMILIAALAFSIALGWGAALGLLFVLLRMLESFLPACDGSDLTSIDCDHWSLRATGRSFDLSRVADLSKVDQVGFVDLMPGRGHELVFGRKSDLTQR
jgi:hypothetical protein